MGNLTVSDVTVPVLLDKLRRREWLVPRFQREFVWSVSAVVDLLISIFEARPIGMATLWEQSDSPELDLKPVYIADYDPDKKCRRDAELAGSDSLPAKRFAVLDGRQRCTAIAMAFGGLRPLYTRNRYAGRYYLDVKTTDEARRVRFEKETDVRRKEYTTDARCIADGLFPLTSNRANEEPFAQWMRYVQTIRDPKFYPNGQLPSPAELDRRDGILKRAFQGMVDTKLAVYVVPSEYHLAQICEIFETLNTTGTQVSTVDLIHSWLYAETKTDPKGPIELRQWIDEFGQKDGAIGWASSSDRPELIAQMVTACYLALESPAKPAPRRVRGEERSAVTSVKADDLLATPPDHWKQVVQNDGLLAEYLRDFQEVAAGGYFPYSECPYPVSAAIYVALRWHAKMDGAAGWGRKELDPLFKAFFWRNALSNRYDQGFLSQLGTDIKQLKAWLTKRLEIPNVADWAAEIQKELSDYMKSNPLPTEAQLVDLLTDARPVGALQKSFSLPMIAATNEDFLDPGISLAYPTGELPELHHIYPRSWCQNNNTGPLANVLDEEKAGRDWVNSMSNLMPLSRKSNNLWKAKNPGAILKEKKVPYQNIRKIAEKVFIDEQCFALLLSGAAGIPRFWEKRASLMATDLLGRTKITF